MNTHERSRPKIHEGQPLVPIGDDELAYRTQLAHWSLTEALFLLSGNKPPGYESTPHIQDHFWSAYNLAVRAIEMDEICHMRERAGERYFFDSPARWFAWAGKQGSQHIKIDERVRRIFTQSDGVEAVRAESGEPKSTPLLSADVDKKYFKRVADYRKVNHGRRPTAEEDEAWRKLNKIPRPRIRELRKSAARQGEEKGGAPARK